MGRHKGSLTAKQKAAMQAGRLKTKAKALEGIIEKVPMTKKSKESPVYGWKIDSNGIVPVFNSEVDSYKGKIYKTIKLAASHLKEE
jgi:hypothetical protein